MNNLDEKYDDNQLHNPLYTCYKSQTETQFLSGRFDKTGNVNKTYKSVVFPGLKVFTRKLFMGETIYYFN